ncbi:hypothetical protein Plhal304r1_c039g0116801 [Plasmopara halstedii]
MISVTYLKTTYSRAQSTNHVTNIVVIPGESVNAALDKVVAVLRDQYAPLVTRLPFQ